MERVISERVYVWQLPVRLYHWINALCVAALAVTGYLIGRPLAVQSAADKRICESDVCSKLRHSFSKQSCQRHVFGSTRNCDECYIESIYLQCSSIAEAN